MSEDRNIRCRDCGVDFTWAAGEQQFFAQMNYNPPVRCKACRDKRKAGTPAAPRMERVASTQPPREIRPVRYEPEPEPDRRTKRQQHKGYRRRDDEEDDYGNWR